MTAEEYLRAREWVLAEKGLPVWQDPVLPNCKNDTPSAVDIQIKRDILDGECHTFAKAHRWAQWKRRLRVAGYP